MKQTVIGLSGHIDHGKTALVKALTGVNTDSLTEEQKRGMTIDIGFAFLDENITLIDVPGHEKFVKNMMAGVSAVDVALLVVAADDGVMPQTREHFEILNLLDIPLGIVAINKIDLADKDWLELVELDIGELLQGSFMEDAPILKVSAETGDGVDQLKTTLLDLCKKVPDKQDRGIFRLHVDRVFSMKGYGTVVTGTVNSGSLKIGDTVELLPGSVKSKVRGLQSHGEEVQQVETGDRAAINLQGVEIKQIERGSQIAEIGYLQSLNQMGVTLLLLGSAQKPITQNQRIRIHLGTQEVMARVALTDGKTLQPGDDCPALLRLEQPMVAARGDKFIIRSFSPVITIGGGEVMEVLIEEKWKIVKEKLQNLYESPKSDQLIHLVQEEGAKPITPEKLQYRIGISKEQINAIVEEKEELFWLTHKQGKWLLTQNQWNELKNSIHNFLKKYHAKNPLNAGAQKEEIRQHLNCENSILEALLQSMLDDKSISQKGELFLNPNFSITLSSEDDSLQNSILNQLDQEGFTSSTLAQLSLKTGNSKEKLMQVLNVAEQQGKLLRIDGKLMFTQKNFIILREKVNQFFSNHPEMSVSEFKELAHTSRKYAVPLLEYFDKKKITYREGNIRKLVR
ncbi:MAG TPA: selenocysteine-specific translation elongation factor [Candidatus Marinimicrobia bacterium]|jgi:selenocysteine-specific elongation factor|nr:selenocysteine-specific translation elongation factor [Candidatus Neomarinimicrobiota bacterium]